MDEALVRLIEAVKASGKKQNHIAREAGLRPSKLNKLLKGHQPLVVKDYIAIARAIKVDPVRLLGHGDLVVPSESLRAVYASLQSAGQILGALLPVESAPPAVVGIPKPAPTRTAQPLRAAAGSNVELFPEIEKTRKRIPRVAWNRGARRIARAIGDSMSGPDGIEDRELVYLVPTRNLRTARGQIVVCRVGDAVYLKKLEIIGSTLRLVSINPDYKTLEYDLSALDFELFGRVVHHAAEA